MAPTGPLINPERYFEQHPDPLRPALAVFVAYVVGSLGALYAGKELLLAHVENPPEGFEEALNWAVFDVAFFTVLFSVIGLPLVAALMHYVGGGTEGDGTFRDTLAVAGWAYAPNLLALPVGYLLLRREITNAALDAADPQALLRQFESIEAATGIGSLLLLLAVTTWSVYILAWGTVGTHDIDDTRPRKVSLFIGVVSFVLGLL